jgi:hypothetical protein
MTQLGEAIARYHKILENEPYRDLAWADALHEQMVARKLAVAGRPICPFLRPHFVNARQYATLIKAPMRCSRPSIASSRWRWRHPRCISRMQLLPAEKMLRQSIPAILQLAVTSLLDTRLHNADALCTSTTPTLLPAMAYAEACGFDVTIALRMKEFRNATS